MRRPLVILAVLFLLSACIGVNMNQKNRDDESKPDPTARSQSDGVETWDLTGAPTAEAFGIEGDRAAAVYETEQPRRVRFELPDGQELTLDAVLVTFERFGDGDDGRFSIGVRTAQLEPDPLVTAFRDVLGQLQVSTGAADELTAEIDAAPDDQTKRISVGSDARSLGDLRLSAQAGLAPVAGSGRVIVGGSWQRD